MSDADQPPARVVFAENLRRARERAGLTQEKLAWAAGLHQTEVGRIEAGRRNPGLETIIKLAHGLGIPAAELLNGL